MLVPGLIRRSPLAQEFFASDDIGGVVIGVIVDDLMVVPDGQPGEIGVGGLQVGIGLVLGVSVPVFV